MCCPPVKSTTSSSNLSMSCRGVDPFDLAGRLQMADQVAIEGHVVDLTISGKEVSYRSRVALFRSLARA
jgi:hypothetical protein